jgi:polar amino acid transport system substrate-binding protein
MAEEAVVVATGNKAYPPSSWIEGEKIIGVASHLLELIFKDIGIKYKSKYVGPWKRTQSYAKAGRFDIITTIYKTQEREIYLDYTEKPYMEDLNVIWVWKGHQFKFDSWHDLIGKPGGAIIGDSYGIEFDKFIVTNLTLERVISIEQNFRKLERNRIVYMPYGLYPGLISAKRFGYHNRIEYLQKPIVSNGLYIAFSKKSPFRQYLPDVNAGIAKYKKNGTITRLIQKYMKQYIDTQPGS